MTITRKLNLSWENDLWQSVVEQDILELRKQLKIIQSSPELIMRDYRLNTQVIENNLQELPGCLETNI